MKHRNTFKRTLSISAALIAISFTVTSVASAAIAVGATGTTKIDTGVLRANTEIKTTLAAPATPVKGVRMEGGVNTAGGVRTDVTGKTGGSVMMQGNATGSMHATGTARALEVVNEHADDGLANAQLHIDLAASAKEEGSATIDAPEKVHTSAELKSFVENKGKADANLKSVDVAEGKVTVTYAMPVKFFGFWHTTMNTTASTDVSGNVTIDYPWYHIFMEKSFSAKAMEPAFTAAVSSTNNMTGETGESASASVAANTTVAIPEVVDKVVTAFAGAAIDAQI